MAKYLKLPKGHTTVCLDKNGTTIGLFHPEPKEKILYKNTLPVTGDLSSETTNVGRFKQEMMKKGDGLLESLPMGPNQHMYGPETQEDMWRWFDKDNWVAAQHMSDLFKMSPDHFVQTMTNRKHFFESERNRQWVPRRHSLRDSESLVPEKPPGEKQKK